MNNASLTMVTTQDNLSKTIRLFILSNASEVGGGLKIKRRLKAKIS